MNPSVLAEWGEIGPVGGFESACLFIVVLYVVARGSIDGYGDWLRSFFGIAAAAWLGEQTCISWYGFYGYADVWALKLGAMPVTVALIWPVVILSAADVAERAVAAGGGVENGPDYRKKVALLTFGIVLLDASLIEPVAVAAGLWKWTEPGVFGVPVIGIVGWAIFSGLWAWRIEDGLLKRAAITLGGMHVALLALWWGGFRWLRADLTEPSPVAVLVALALAMIAVCAVLIRRRPHVDMRRALLRTPGALYFGVLLVEIGAPWPLWLWVGLLAAPWLVAVTVLQTDETPSRLGS